MTSRGPLQILQICDSVKMSSVMFMSQVCPTLGCQGAAEEVVVSHKEGEFVGRNGLSSKPGTELLGMRKLVIPKTRYPFMKKHLEELNVSKT